MPVVIRDLGLTAALRTVRRRGEGTWLLVAARRVGGVVGNERGVTDEVTERCLAGAVVGDGGAHSCFPAEPGHLGALVLGGEGDDVPPLPARAVRPDRWR